MSSAGDKVGVLDRVNILTLPQARVGTFYTSLALYMGACRLSPCWCRSRWILLDGGTCMVVMFSISWQSAMFFALRVNRCSSGDSMQRCSIRGDVHAW